MTKVKRDWFLEILGIAPPYLVNRWDSVHELAVKFKLGEEYVVIWKTEGALFGS